MSFYQDCPSNYQIYDDFLSGDIIIMLVFCMVKESNEVYKNENKEFDEAVELYRK